MADLDGNGGLEIVALGDLHNLHILPIKGTDNYGKLEWPQYKRDKYNTNCSPQDSRFINRLPRFLNKPSYMKIMEGKLLKFSMYASDPDKNFMDLGIIGLPKGASFKQDAKTPGFSSAEFSWKPDFIQQGQYNVTFTVTDNIGPLVKKNVLIDVIDDPSGVLIDPKNYTP